MSLRKSVIFVFALLILTLSIPAFAQKETGVIQGTISDVDGQPIPGVSVVAASPSLIGGSQTTYSDQEGRYRFPALPPGTYQISAELQGFQKVVRKEIRLFVGNSIGVDLSLQAEKVSETIEVTGEAPLIDKTTAATSNTVPIEAVENLPKFSFALDLFTLTPGVGSDYIAYGAAGDSANAYWLDGVNVSDPEGGTPWVFPNYNWLQEVQVSGIGAPAEYGGFTGVVTNSITRSGGNEFHGLLETFYQNDAMTSTNSGSLPSDLQNTLVPPTEKKFSDNTAQIGGPIKRDKIWFFTSFQYLAEDTVPLGFLGVHTERDPRVFAKVTYKADQNTTLQGFMEWDKYDIHGRGADVDHNTIDVTLTEKAPEVSWNTTLIKLFSSDTVLDARFSGFSGYYHLTPQHGQTPSHFDPCAETNANGDCVGHYLYNHPYTYLADRQRYQVNASLSHYARNFIHGDHDFKFGMEFERSGVQSKYYYNGGVYYYDYAGGLPYYRYLFSGYDINTPLHRTSLYAQDSWDINKHLNINAGVRLDHNRGLIKGVGTVFKTDPVAPRIGFTYDVKGDQQSVIKGHYGRYYEAMFSDYFSPLSPNWGSYITQYFYSDTNEWVTTGTKPHHYQMDPNIKHPYVDQWTIGLDQALPGDIAVGGHYIYRKWGNIIDGVNITGQFVPLTVINPVTGQPITVYNQINNPEDDVFLQTVPKAGGLYPDALFRKYHAVEVFANRRMSKKLYLSASFVWSKIRGTADNDSYSSTGSNTGLFSKLFDDPNFNININGRLSNDPTYEIKLQGSYALPWGINTSWYFNHTTGDTWTPLTRIRGLDQGYPVRIFALPRGSNRLATQNTLDIRAEKEIPISKGALRVTADIFNVFNTGYADAVQDRFESNQFGDPTSFTTPRYLRLGFRYTF